MSAGAEEMEEANRLVSSILQSVDAHYAIVGGLEPWGFREIEREAPEWNG